MFGLVLGRLKKDPMWALKKGTMRPVWPKTFLLDLLDKKYKRQSCAEFYADLNGIKIPKFEQKVRNIP